jgi:GT2 family glycosyltransferase
MKKVAVILVNFHSEVDLAEVIPSVEESLVPKGFERKVIVVDNASRDEGWGKVQKIAKPFNDIHLIRSLQNTGFAGGNNLGIMWAKRWGAEYFLLLNVDTKVKKDFLVELVRAVQKDGKIGLAASKIYFYPGYEFHKDRYQKSDLGKVIWYGGGLIDWNNMVGFHRFVNEIDEGQLGDKVEETEFATGCSMFITKEVIEKVGLLDEKIFFSWEDVDYSIRARKMGFEIAYVPGSIVWHKNANTSGGAGSPVQDFYQTRNRLIVGLRYASWKVKILLLWLLLRTANWNRLKAIVSAMLVETF